MLGNWKPSLNDGLLLSQSYEIVDTRPRFYTFVMFCKKTFDILITYDCVGETVARDDVRTRWGVYFGFVLVGYLCKKLQVDFVSN